MFQNVSDTSIELMKLRGYLSDSRYFIFIFFDEIVEVFISI